MNKMRLRILCTVLAGVLAAVPSLADTALVWSSGNPDGNTAGVAAYIAQYGCFSTVEAVDADFVPLSTLVNYDVVLYFSNHSGSQDPVAIGDVLADYADTGRHLVIATFSWANQGGNTLAGRVISDQISPLLPLGSSVYSSVTMSSHDGSGYFIAVNSVDGYFTTTCPSPLAPYCTPAGATASPCSPTRATSSASTCSPMTPLG